MAYRGIIARESGLSLTRSLGVANKDSVSAFPKYDPICLIGGLMRECGGCNSDRTVSGNPLRTRSLTQCGVGQEFTRGEFMTDVAPETPEACEEAAIQAIVYNKTSDAVVFSNLAIAKAITRLAEVIAKREK